MEIKELPGKLYYTFIPNKNKHLKACLSLSTVKLNQIIIIYLFDCHSYKQKMI